MKEKASSSRTLKRVIQNLEGQKHLVVLSFLLALVSVAGTLFVPILVGRAIDEIVGPGQVDFAALGTIGVQIAVTAGVVALSQWLMNIINNKITFCVTREVRQQAFSHLQTLPLSYLDAHPSGEIVSRMISDTEQFADGLLLGFTQLFTGADGVILCGCHPGDCHYTTGNYYARRRMTLLFSMLDFLGIEKGRTRVEWVSAAEGAKFAATMNEFVKTITELGENRRLEDLRCKE